MPTDALMQTDLPLPGRRQGKVRDIYEGRTTAGQDALIIIASDRISAFDVVMPNGIPGKGIVLTQISRFWFDLVADKLGGRIGHHLISTDPADIEGLSDEQVAQLRGRVMIGRKSEVVPIECVVRGYLAGSGWKEYQKSGTVCGIALPPGLKQSDKLPEPIFTPSTKAEVGHDENITFEQACEIAGRETMEKLRDTSLSIYQMGHDYARERGIILADTKFEFGYPGGDKSQDPILIDEVLTPDSSRFWPADRYEVGRDQPSYDKQYVRNYLQELVDAGKWDKEPPGPTLPDEIVRNTLDKYLDAYRKLTGEDLEL
ncbi:MAG: phosphoribosylaminoimidazolesuccinocarboxamide synthase [Phycisphaeraceae bacterium]